MNLLTETFLETSPAGVPAICLDSPASLYSDRPTAVTEKIEPSWCVQRRLTEKLERFLLTRPPSPVLAVDLDVIQAKYRELRTHFPTASIYYAVKANPATEVVALLAAMGSSFDIASPSELDLCLELGVHPASLSYGNTIKKAVDIEYAFRSGVRRFVFDSEAELRKLGKHARGALVICRIQTSGENAGWPLSKKFGCDIEMASDLLLMTRDLGLKAIGISFHVGSQQTDPTQWKKPLRETAGLFHKLARRGIALDIVNIGGGFPVPYEGSVPPVCQFAGAIAEAMNDAFGDSKPKLMLEPGRSRAGLAQVAL